jgi:hypothetical protein
MPVESPRHGAGCRGGAGEVVRGHGGHARARGARWNAAADGGAAARVEAGEECDGCGGEWADAWAGPRRSGFPGLI